MYRKKPYSDYQVRYDMRFGTYEEPDVNESFNGHFRTSYPYLSRERTYRKGYGNLVSPISVEDSIIPSLYRRRYVVVPKIGVRQSSQSEISSLHCHLVVFSLIFAALFFILIQCDSL